MPPRFKYTKEEIVEGALDLVRKEGIEGLNARAVGKRLGISSSPIFTAFASMEDLQQHVFEAAQQKFYEYTGDYKQYSPPAKRWGMQCIKFAKDEPKLFQLLFMQEQVEIPLFADSMTGLQKEQLPDDLWDYTPMLSMEEKRQIFENLWIFVFGICAMEARGVCDFSEEESARRISEMFAGQVMMMKSDKQKFTEAMPIKGVHQDVMGRKEGDLPYID